VLGVVENMAGLRQRADAFRFTLPGAGGAAGSGKQQPVGGGSGSATAEERDVTEQVLAALRQVDPSLEVGYSICESRCQIPQRYRDVREQVLAAPRQVKPSLEMGIVTTLLFGHLPARWPSTAVYWISRLGKLHSTVCTLAGHSIRSASGTACQHYHPRASTNTLKDVPSGLCRAWWPQRRCFTAAAAAAAAALQRP
jgi:hypothetical protein